MTLEEDIIARYTSKRKPSPKTVSRHCKCSISAVYRALRKNGIALRPARWKLPLNKRRGPHQRTLDLYDRYMELGGRKIRGLQTMIAKEYGVTRQAVSQNILEVEKWLEEISTGYAKTTMESAQQTTVYSATSVSWRE